MKQLSKVGSLTGLLVSIIDSKGRFKASARFEGYQSLQPNGAGFLSNLIFLRLFSLATKIFLQGLFLISWYETSVIVCLTIERKKL
ncbi:hypothetical protein Bca4012_034546 [Brassica carinata]